MEHSFKNKLFFDFQPNPIERRKNISKEIIRYADFLPKTVKYEDIDNSFKEWVEKSFVLIYDDIKLPTMTLYSNQRFSEYIQTWTFTDENNNIRLNFKTITRENNPSHGTIVGDSYNIPGDRFYKLKSIPAIDENGKKYSVDYKMKQPTAVDIIYKVSIMTNKYTLINEFNETIHQIFNSKQSYISPNGHFMPIILDSISDESEYNIEDRQFFSQTFKVKVKGYIIKENDFIIEENPIATVVCFEGDTAKRRKPTIELSEYEPCPVEDEEEIYYKKPIEIDVDLSYCYPCKGKTKFTMDEDFILTDFKLKEPSNMVSDEIKLYVNDILITNNLYHDAYEGYTKCNDITEELTSENSIEYDEMPIEYNKVYKYILYNGDYYVWHQIHFSDGDEIIIETKRINRYINTSGFILYGYNRFVSYNANEEYEGTKIEIEPQKECITNIF